MNKLKLFLENFLIYGLGGVIGKIIPLLMVPVITRLMPDASYFGFSDLTTTLTSFGSALAMMGMYDAMYRLFFDREDRTFQEEICSTTLSFTLMTSLVVSVAVFLLRKPLSILVYGSEEYTLLVCLSALAIFVSTTNNIVSAPTRMQNRRRVYLVMNIITPVVSYSISVVFLLQGHYLIALPVAAVLTGLTSEMIFYCLNWQWFSLKRVTISHLRPLLSIAIPLLPIFLIYWVFHSCDRLMLTHLIGAGATGIYAVSAKLGQASQLIHTAFAGGWQYFAFSTMKEENQVESNSRIFEYLGILSFSTTTFVFVLAEPAFRILFPEDYLSGFVASPYLFLAPLLLMLYQVIGNQFLIVKKTWPGMLILSFGAVVNVTLNYLLIPPLGVEGAAIATLCGYVVSVLLCALVLYRMKLFVIRWRFLIASAVMVGFILVWRFTLLHSVLWSLVASILCCIIFLILYRKDLMSLKKG